ncbi:hypothetical protein SLEP1_g10509 [Rubroshorea leprosula]|uniref:Uncharacterized protein n=1 Tax=Rubroshorea leprosula TaxID=152421 RepID=A0AAV5II86_9ROSI|nr:hypothetical protein SLEP1_g10509 [Rubroshorea leprosula]
MDEDHKNEAEVVTRHKDSSSSSGSSQELIFLPKNVLKHKSYSSSPPIDPQSFSFISSPEDSFTQSPEGYDPSRIPSSIFSSKPANPMEWSAASNESLFSIQIGNNSFTRDHAFMLYKSGELIRAEDQQGNVQGSQLPPVNETEVMATVGGEIKVESLGVTGAPVDLLKEDFGGREVVGEQEVKNETLAMEAYNSTITCMSHRSDGTGSNHSARSFAFPVLAPSASEDGRNYYCSVNVGSEKHDVQRQRKSQELPPKQSPREELEQPKASGQWFPRASGRWFPKFSGRWFPKTSGRWFSCLHCCRSLFS